MGTLGHPGSSLEHPLGCPGGPFEFPGVPFGVPRVLGFLRATLGFPGGPFSSGRWGACMHPAIYSVWCVVNNDGISSIKIDELSQRCRTRTRVGSCPYLPLPRGARVHQIYNVLIVIILTKNNYRTWQNALFMRFAPGPLKKLPAPM